MRGRKAAFSRGGTYHRLRLPLATAISIVSIPQVRRRAPKLIPNPSRT
jgi:hypothetical protein